jgi:hypothetical protein
VEQIIFSTNLDELLKMFHMEHFVYSATKHLVEIVPRGTKTYIAFFINMIFMFHVEQLLIKSCRFKINQFAVSIDCINLRDVSRGTQYPNFDFITY